MVGGMVMPGMTVGDWSGGGLLRDGPMPRLEAWPGVESWPGVVGWPGYDVGLG